MDYILLIITFGFFITKFNDNVQAFRSKRMVGGNRTEHGKYPYQVRIKANDDFICGGSILDDYHVISAAHCFIEKIIFSDDVSRNISMEVVAGITDEKKDNRTQWVVAKIKKIYLPKIFNDSLMVKMIKSADISILKLETSLNLTKNSHIRAVDLPENTDLLYANETAVVTGYGLNYVTAVFKSIIDGKEYYLTIGNNSNVLHFANTTILRNSECQRKYNTYQMSWGWDERHPRILEKHICAQVNQRDPLYPEGICNGDSGGPLVYNGTIQIGVVSASGIGCKEDFYPAVYTRVSAFMDFIRKVQNYNGSSINDPEIIEIQL